MGRTRTCSHHEGRPAVATCAACEQDICGACHRADDRGFAICPGCRGESPARSPEWERAGSRYSPEAFIRTIYRFLRAPRAAFSSFPVEGSWVPALVFGYLCTVVGMLLGRLGAVALDPSFGEALGQFATTNDLSTSRLRLLVVLATPVSALLAVGTHIVALRIAARVAGVDMTWEASARIAGYALGAAIFIAIPPIYGFEIGVLLTIFWLYNHESAALHHRYDMSRWRAALTVVLPALFLVTCVG